ncbi:MAG: citrate synthase [Solirubrobacteraceae bacterium]
MSRNTLTVIDNRTGRRWELAVEDGAVRAEDLRQIPLADGDGLVSFDPGFTNTASCRSAITHVDGEAGILQHRGYRIESLCQHSTFLEVAYLLIYGELPSAEQLERWTREITTHNFVHENVKRFLQGFRYDANPMVMLAASVGALSSFYADAGAVHDQQARQRQVVRLLSKMPTLAAFSYRHVLGRPYVYPEDDLTYAGNLLSMMFRMSEPKYQPDPRMERALDVLLMLHADHEQNASTTAVRAVGSTHVDPYSAVAAGVAALSGPMRGAADEAVLKMLARIGTVADVPDFLASVKAGRERLMGFGHWMYKTYDPRARILRAQLDALYETREKNPLVLVAFEVERRALDDEFFTSRRVYPNVDLYSGLTYEAIGVPPAMFPVMFALARSAGWIAQWREMVSDPEQQTVRPRQIYTGELDRDYLPVAQRD